MKQVEEKINKLINEILTSESNYTTFKELLNEQLDFLHSDEEKLYFLHHIPSNESFYNITRTADVFYTHFEDLKKLNQYIANLLMKFKGKNPINIKTLECRLNTLEKKTLHTKLLQEGFIAENITEEHFIHFLSGKEIIEKYKNKKIEWLKSIPLFCCLFYGFNNMEFNGKTIDFKGIINEDTGSKYKKAELLFSFGNRKVTNKTLSEKVHKITYANAPKDYSLLHKIIETIQNSTV